MPNINTIDKKMKEASALRAVRHFFKEFWILSFDPVIIPIFQDLCCNLHTIGNYVLNMHTLDQKGSSKIKEEFVSKNERV